MKEHPILFSGPMVRAILEGHKTQTRRLMKMKIETSHDGMIRFSDTMGGFIAPHVWRGFTKCPYGDRGDRLWVRETFAHLDDLRTKDPGVYALQSRAFFRADHPTGLSHDDGKDLIWRPSIFMPRALSRITLEITDVRVDRLQDISVEDIVAEGVQPIIGKPYKAGMEEEWRNGWDKINGKRAPWATNPWVFAITFNRM